MYQTQHILPVQAGIMCYYIFMNKYILIIAGLSLILAAYFYGKASAPDFLGLIPVTNLDSLQNGITAAGYIFGAFFVYSGVRKMRVF